MLRAQIAYLRCMESAQELRKLIEQYRARLARGASAALVAFILQRIAEAEAKLAELEAG
jgi:hypothetical protein